MRTDGETGGWTLDEMSARYLRGRSRLLAGIFAGVGRKWGISGTEVFGEYYIFVRRYEAGDGETRTEQEWGASVRKWGKRNETRAMFLKQLGAKRKEAEVRDDLGFETLAEARAHLQSIAYGRFAVTQHVDHAGMRLSPSDAVEHLLHTVDRGLAGRRLSDAARRGVAAFLLRICGWTDEEIAVGLGMAAASIRTYRQRGKAVVADVLGWAEVRA